MPACHAGGREFESRPVRHFSYNTRLPALYFDIHTQIHTHKFWLELDSSLLFDGQALCGYSLYIPPEPLKSTQ